MFTIIAVLNNQQYLGASQDTFIFIFVHPIFITQNILEKKQEEFVTRKNIIR